MNEAAPELTDSQRLLLTAVADLQGSALDGFVSTTDAGAKVLELLKKAGHGYSFMSTAPWHGTSPEATQLEDLGLLQVDVGMATFVAPGQPAPTPDSYALSVTEEGRKVLAQGASSS